MQLNASNPPRTFSPVTLTLSRIVRQIRPAEIASGLGILLGLGQRRPYATRHGLFAISPISDLGETILESGEYEPAMVAVLHTYLDRGGIFIDLGANEGYFSVIGSALVGAGGRVIAIEPQSRLQPVISTNLKLNHCANTEMQQVLLSGADGESDLILTPQVNPGASSIYPGHLRLRGLMPRERVESLTLASFLKRTCVAKCDLMKVDIEGAEWELLMNAGDVLKSGVIRHIALEIHNSILAARGVSGGDLHKFILGCGYTLDDSLGPWVYCKTAN